MYRYSWLINVGCICGLIVLAGALAPKENTVTGPPVDNPVVQAPKVVLADGKWGQSNQAKSTGCTYAIMAAAKATKHLNDADHLATAKEAYWACIIHMEAAL